MTNEPKVVIPEHITDPADVLLRLYASTTNKQHLLGYLQIMRARHLQAKLHVDELTARIEKLEKPAAANIGRGASYPK
jgi:hypothetical protein